MVKQFYHQNVQCVAVKSQDYGTFCFNLILYKMNEIVMNFYWQEINLCLK